MSKNSKVKKVKESVKDKNNLDDTNKVRTLDEIFAPFREHTEKISEQEIDKLVKKARREVR